jgi:hypothetical protein
VPQYHHAVARRPHVRVHHGWLLNREIPRVSEGDHPLPLRVGKRLKGEFARGDESRTEKARTAWRNIVRPPIQGYDALLIAADLGSDIDKWTEVAVRELREKLARVRLIDAAEDEIGVTEPHEHVVGEDIGLDSFDATSQTEPFNRASENLNLRDPLCGVFGGCMQDPVEIDLKNKVIVDQDDVTAAGTGKKFTEKRTRAAGPDHSNDHLGETMKGAGSSEGKASIEDRLRRGSRWFRPAI